MAVQLLYVSAPLVPVRESLAHFVPLAQEKNKEFGITGMIVSGEEFYVQVLEGERALVNQLYKNIVKDDRHHHCTLLRYNEVQKRDFPNWSMAHTTIEEMTGNYIGVVKSADEITPKELTAIKAMALLRRIYAVLSV
jgi:GMP synthase PP-ATPase subunit